MLCLAATNTRFFLLRYSALRELHSFPTRRSSDLRLTLGCLVESAVGRTLPVHGRRKRRVLVVPLDTLGSLPEGRPGRSEEHTSELQSRRDLVCRLLLEKKKGAAPRSS